MFERFQFWKLTQALGEIIDSFVTSLRLRTKSCEFSDQEESLIRDRIIIGGVDFRLQEQLLREVDLNLSKALNICCTVEATKEQVELLQTCSISVSSVTAVHVVKNNFWLCNQRQERWLSLLRKETSAENLPSV